MIEQYYDVVDEEGNLIETAESQRLAAQLTPPEPVKEIPLERNPPKLSPTDIGKLRKQYVTVTQSRVRTCGHKIDLSRQPKYRNCQSCWMAFFSQHKELVDQLIEMHKAGPEGDTLIVQLQGKKFLEMYFKFMSTLYKWSQESENINEQTS